MGSWDLSAAESAAPAAPSAELLLYLAEFGSEQGDLDDPIAVAKALEDRTDSGQNEPTAGQTPETKTLPPTKNQTNAPTDSAASKESPRLLP